MPGDNPALVKARKGFSVSYKGKTLLSNIDPAAHAERAAGGFSIQDRTLYFCPSPLLGYGLEKLLEKMSHNAPRSALLCVEADRRLLELSLKNLSAELTGDERFRVTGITDKAALCAFVRQTWGARYFRRIEPVRLGGGWRLSEELYANLEETLRREIALDWSNALTLTRLGRLYMRNALRNLALIPRYVSLERLSFGRAPVLVLGAGPSLDSLLDQLEARFGQNLRSEARPFKIICADTCLGALRARNIKPDLAVILESQHWNLRDFIGLGDWNIKAALDLSALPAQARLSRIQPYLFFTPWTSLRLFERMDKAGLLPVTLPPLGSVGLSAVAAALRLTSGAVFTGGMDFSFTVDSYHARGTPGHGDKLRRHNRLRGVLNEAAFGTGVYTTVSKNGEPVRSSPAMRNYRDMFEREFSGEPRLFDCVSSGLPLGTITLPPDVFFTLLGKGGKADTKPRGTKEKYAAAVTEKSLAEFIEAEKNRITALRDILSGETAAAAEELETLVAECDYLWAHFPDYAASDGRRPSAKDFLQKTPEVISFLKRVQAEAGAALAVFESLLADAAE